MTEQLTFIHLSDIHFSKQSGGSVYDLDADVRNELALDAGRLIQKIGPATGVLVTGDIAFSGKRQEYEKAAEWLKVFCGSIVCSDENVWVVPGNHDVDHTVISSSKSVRNAHNSLRGCSVDRVDAELSEQCTDPQTARALFDPLAEYNQFAERYQCGICSERPFWERDHILQCGTIIRLRGLCSVLVSDYSDSKGKLILGTAQAAAPRISGVRYLTLCHHPPDWLFDQDAVSDHLNARVQVQLFGHKHRQRLYKINESVLLTAGAMHPDRSEKEWEPMYNALQVFRKDENSLAIRIYQRRWHKESCQFTPYGDPDTGLEYYEMHLTNCPIPALENSHQPLESALPAPPQIMTPPALDTSASASPQFDIASVQAMVNPRRRMTYRFLTLPFRHQIAVAQSLNVLNDQDRALSNASLFTMLFARAASACLLDRLWQETEQRHQDPATFNPFTDR